MPLLRNKLTWNFYFVSRTFWSVFVGLYSKSEHTRKILGLFSYVLNLYFHFYTELLSQKIIKNKKGGNYRVGAKPNFAPLRERLAQCAHLPSSHERGAAQAVHHFNVIWCSASSGSSVMQLMSHEFSLRALLREPNLLTKCGENSGERKEINNICGKNNLFPSVQDACPN